MSARLITPLRSRSEVKQRQEAAQLIGESKQQVPPLKEPALRASPLKAAPRLGLGPNPPFPRKHRFIPTAASDLSRFGQ